MKSGQLDLFEGLLSQCNCVCQLTALALERAQRKHPEISTRSGCRSKFYYVIQISNERRGQMSRSIKLMNLQNLELRLDATKRIAVN